MENLTINRKNEDYTIQPSDDGSMIVCDNPGPITITVPPGLEVAFNCAIVQWNTGPVFIGVGEGVRVNSSEGHAKTAKRYAAMSLVAITENEFLLGGHTS